VTPEDVPSGPLLVDTDVLSWLALGEDLGGRFAPLLAGHQLFVCFVTVAEVRTFLRMNVLAGERAEGLRDGLDDPAVVNVRLADVVSEWVQIRAATITAGTVDDRERRQNDTWIAACALSVEPPLPIVTGKPAGLHSPGERLVASPRSSRPLGTQHLSNPR
jgi:predicted nucleic acid-binding protein